MLALETRLAQIRSWRADLLRTLLALRSEEMQSAPVSKPPAAPRSGTYDSQTATQFIGLIAECRAMAERDFSKPADQKFALDKLDETAGKLERGEALPKFPLSSIIARATKDGAYNLASKLEELQKGLKGLN